MADEISTSWESLLPDVFNLLLHKPEKIVDDTSIEKLIAWVSDVCISISSRSKFIQYFSTFLSNVKLLDSSTTASFALRVCAVLWRLDNSISKDYPTWIDIFVEVKASQMLWAEAVVRHAYFTGLTSAVTFDTGIEWIHDNKGNTCETNPLQIHPLPLGSTTIGFMVK